eukprot:gene362-375_t
MRYNLDFILGEVFGQTVLKSLSTRHEDVVILPFVFTFKRFAADVERELKRFCVDQNKKRVLNITATVVIQTGHWDLTSKALRYLLYDDIGPDKLSLLIEDILKGQVECHGLVKIVWVTAVPYPLCVNNNSLACAGNAGFRNGGTLAALNEYYLRRLLAVSQSSSRTRRSPAVSLAVVDAYSIIHPRLFLLETEEVTCHNHFLCRPSNANMTVTPGGLAVVEALKWAMC